MNDNTLPAVAFAASLNSVEDIVLPDAQPYAAYGIGGGLCLVAIAALAVFQGWPDVVAYLLAAGGLGTMIGGLVAASRQDDRRLLLAKAMIAAVPAATLAHATLDLSLTEKTRVLIANHLNSVDPEWHTRLESNSDDWQALKAAGANMGGCFRSCSSSSCK